MQPLISCRRPECVSVDPLSIMTYSYRRQTVNWQVQQQKAYTLLLVHLFRCQGHCVSINRTIPADLWMFFKES